MLAKLIGMTQGPRTLITRYDRLVLLDDYSHFCWSFPLRHKSDVQRHIVDFVAFAHTQFGILPKCFQADNGTEFVNNATTTFLTSRGIVLRCSCPYTSPQNGKAERMLRTINNTIRTLLIHAYMPPPYWAEALAAATYVLNRRPSSSVHHSIPYHLLHQKLPDYSSLRVFGCLCYPNLSATTPHKLSPRSTPCVFLGYPSSHKGYRCLDMSSRRIIISRHAVFDEFVFPFASAPSAASVPSSLDFLMQGLSSTTEAPPLGVERPRTASVAPSPGAVEQLDLPDPAVIYAGPLHPSGRLAGTPTAAPPEGGRPVGPLPPAGAPTAALPAGGRPIVYQRRPPLPPAPPVPLTPVAAPAPPPPSRPTTRSQTGSLRPVHRLNLSATTASPIPANYRSALADPSWRAAMAEEYKALMDNGTWRLVPRPSGANIVTGKWLYKHKFHSDGSLARHKARWVV